MAQMKFVVWQAGHEYPLAHIIITDNERYWKCGRAFDTMEEALDALKKWMEKNRGGFDGRSEKAAGCI